MANDRLSARVQSTNLSQIRHTIQSVTHKWGVHTQNYLRSAGFTYTGIGDTARCDECGLEVSNWTSDMVPITIHSQQSPHCPIINSTIESHRSSFTVVPNTASSMSNIRETIPVLNSPTSINSGHSSNNFVENDEFKRMRKRTLSHWPHDTNPSATQMSDAGFFGCNVADRVICIYCDLMCERWTADTENPCEVHKKCSPNCAYVKKELPRSVPIPIINVNGRLPTPGTARPPSTSNNIHSRSFSEFARPPGQENLFQNDQPQSIDDSIQGSYFSIDVKGAAVCPKCKRAFRYSDSNENPMIDHALRYPNCSYAQSFQGVGAYRRQTDAQPQPEWTYQTIRNMVLERLTWPVSRNLFNQNYSLDIIGRCLWDQLRIKGEDFVSDGDMKLACLIQQKQYNYFRAQRTVIIPREHMAKLREDEIRAQEDMVARIRATMTNGTTGQEQSANLEDMYQCVICRSERKCLAFLPCGHLATCVPCGFSLPLCPMCRGLKEAVIRIDI